ncbi:electron transfer flavoprotein subunit alpha/FixB family protein [Geobacter grbiciae]|uniref:electron transfer flavoprotein subunit alpha/FixB family protein n=1 Tax=Geobacter grbiciae TaxID=155042 RepID=UPI001C023C51|nr:electron transfer flavoprotein subunit alpha/FixB family protein [Geobacter grbiciae]
MKALIVSTDECRVKKLHQFVSRKNIVEEARGICLDLNDVVASDVYGALASTCDLSKYELIILSDRELDHEIAGILSRKLGASCATCCCEVANQGGVLNLQREVYGGIAHINLIAKHFPLVITISGASISDESPADATVEILTVPPGSSNTAILSKKEIAKAVDLASARKIVAVGRGVGKKEDLALFNQLTAILGAELGCSRPLSEDYKWLPLERQVGLTGETVKPNLYLAVGISGQVQHIAGMRDSKIIVAINNNRSAPIFESCDYGLIGDLYEIVPALVNSLS